MNLGGAFLTEKELTQYPFRRLGKNVKVHSIHECSVFLNWFD